MKKQNISKNSGFTIVELLVVIVIIGILATLTIVSFTNVSSRAIAASLKSDLSTSARLLKAYQVDNGSYPNDIEVGCSTPPNNTTACIKLSPGNELDNQQGNPAYSRPTNQSFILRIKNGSKIFIITDKSEPTEVAPLTAIGAFIGTAQQGLSLAAGVLSPDGATATYQWKLCTNNTDINSCSNIINATNNSYTPVSNDVGKYLRVVATGSGSYSGSVTSAPTSAVAALPPVSVSISGSAFTNSQWGGDWSESCDPWVFTTKSSFNLSSYPSSQGSFTSAIISWSRGSFGSAFEVAYHYKFLRRDDTQAILQTWDIRTDVTSLSNDALLAFINSKRGGTATLFWDSDDGGMCDTWGVQSSLSAPTLTLIWQPS